MAGLVLRTASAWSTSAEFAVELDATEPFLNDHRPGGHPLLGTVMGLELMTRGVSDVLGVPPSVLGHVSHVIVREPIILTGESATAYIRVTRAIGEAQQSFHCDVETRDDPVVVHFSAMIACADPKPPSEAMKLDTTDSPLPVQAGDVYALFFHGPAFQVIQRAGLVNNTVVAEVASNLPDLTGEPGDVDGLAPRLIEACLQTAGLLEVATRSRMMIPSRIDSIDFLGERSALPDRLFTCARRSTASDGADAIDIDVVDPDSASWLQVRGYQTLPLPFASDSMALSDLNNAFRRNT